MGNEACMRNTVNAHTSLGRNLKARDHLKDLGKEGWIILNLILIHWGREDGLTPYS